MEAEKPKSDFRYGTGEAKVPWDAVAVKPDRELLVDMVQFLVGPGDDRGSYDHALGRVEAALAELCKYGRPATKLTLGDKVKAVEDKARAYLGVQHACFLVNWTAGYDMALDMTGVREGDEVIVPAITFIATASPIMRKGAKVVFADVLPDTLNMDPADLERKITPRTKAIVPVHIGGYPAEMDAIMAIAKDRGITVIEDAAHGFGGTYKGRKLGSIGDFGAFSFHEVKNVTSLGEGGLLISNDPLGEQFAMARFCGFDTSSAPRNWLYDISPIRAKDGYFPATNYSVTEIQAVAMLRMMALNDRVTSERRQAALRLYNAFSGVDGLTPGPLWNDVYGATFHLFLLRVDPNVIDGGIQLFKEILKQKGITQIPHFCPLYHYRIFQTFGYDQAEAIETCPNAERAFFEEYTHLPLYGLTDAQLDYMIDAIADTAKQLKR